MAACPPRAPMAWTATSMRGPTTNPSRMALRRPTSRYSLDPRSRTVVKPASKTRRAYAEAKCDCSVAGRCRSSTSSLNQLALASNVRCSWASMRPGRRVESPKSIVSVEGSALASAPTFTMRLAPTGHAPGLDQRPFAGVEQPGGAEEDSLRGRTFGERRRGEKREECKDHWAVLARFVNLNVNVHLNGFFVTAVHVQVHVHVHVAPWIQRTSFSRSAGVFTGSWQAPCWQT